MSSLSFSREMAEKDWDRSSTSFFSEFICFSAEAESAESCSSFLLQNWGGKSYASSLRRMSWSFWRPLRIPVSSAIVASFVFIAWFKLTTCLRSPSSILLASFSLFRIVSCNN